MNILLYIKYVIYQKLDYEQNLINFKSQYPIFKPMLINFFISIGT